MIETTPVVGNLDGDGAALVEGIQTLMLER